MPPLPTGALLAVKVESAMSSSVLSSCSENTPPPTPLAELPTTEQLRMTVVPSIMYATPPLLRAVLLWMMLFASTRRESTFSTATPPRPRSASLRSSVQRSNTASDVSVIQMTPDQRSPVLSAMYASVTASRASPSVTNTAPIIAVLSTNRDAAPVTFTTAAPNA